VSKAFPGDNLSDFYYIAQAAPARVIVGSSIRLKLDGFLMNRCIEDEYRKTDHD